MSISSIASADTDAGDPADPAGEKCAAGAGNARRRPRQAAMLAENKETGLEVAEGKKHACFYPPLFSLV